MTPDQARQLLGGYATQSLTPAEREALFAAALEHQEIFDELMREQPLAELLADPEARDQLDRLLQPAAPPVPVRPVRQVPAAWPGRPWFALAAASAAIALFATVFYLSQRPPEPVTVSVAQPAPQPVPQPESQPAPQAPLQPPPPAREPPPSLKKSAPQPLAEKQAVQAAPPPAAPPGVIGGIASGTVASGTVASGTVASGTVASGTAADQVVLVGPAPGSSARGSNALESGPAYRNTLATPILHLAAFDAESNQPLDPAQPLPAGRPLRFLVTASQPMTVAFTANSTPPVTVTAIAGSATVNPAPVNLVPGNATSIAIALRLLPNAIPQTARLRPSNAPTLTFTIPAGDQATYELKILSKP